MVFRIVLTGVNQGDFGIAALRAICVQAAGRRRISSPLSLLDNGQQFIAIEFFLNARLHEFKLAQRV